MLVLRPSPSLGDGVEVPLRPVVSKQTFEARARRALHLQWLIAFTAGMMSIILLGSVASVDFVTLPVLAPKPSATDLTDPLRYSALTPHAHPINLLPADQGIFSVDDYENFTAESFIPMPPVSQRLTSREDFIRYENRHPSSLDDFQPEPSYITACVMVKGAVESIPEFVHRNKLAGIDHFAFIDDNDPQTYQLLHAVLEPMSAYTSLFRSRRDTSYLASGANRPVWLADTQMNANLDCASAVAPFSTWVAFIDVDEFFEVRDPYAAGLDVAPDTPFLRDVLRKSEASVPAVCVPWRTVLTNGRVAPVECEETLVDAFPTACNDTDFIGFQKNPLARAKTIAQVRYLFYDGTPRDDSYAHTGYRYTAPYADFECQVDSQTGPLVLLHYWSGSVMEYVHKMVRGRPRHAQEGRTMFELMLREYLCSHKLVDESSSMRNEAVKAAMRRAGYVCEASISYSHSGRDMLVALNDSNAMQYLVAKELAGHNFDEAAYQRSNQLTVKKVFGGYLSHIQLMPWVHYALHGYKAGVKDTWFK